MDVRWAIATLLLLASPAAAQERAAGAGRGAPAPAPGPEVTEEGTFYTVQAGDTLSEIALRLGVPMQDLLLLNEGLRPDRLSVGQRLRIGSGRRRVEHVVRTGDTLARLATYYEVTLPELRRWNPRVRGDTIREGRTLLVFTPQPASRSRSVGSANQGRLDEAAHLPEHHPGILVRFPTRAYGTDETIRWLLEAVDAVRSEVPETPRLEVGDLSRREGGALMGHRSHTSGRDADVAYYRTRCADACPMRTVTASELDVARQWRLFRHWLERDRVEAIFVDHELQEALYRHAVAEGVDRRLLDRWFQYPREADNRYGIIRHHPRHQNHFHVRFVCHESDEECR
ncbi:MAG: penicillin-insensitive murein endopeptidase [Sandaracinaceae bacterium]|nr:penicillin-insensitive murein endopeptidase [Sandaracinaceae bacterium]